MFRFSLRQLLFLVATFALALVSLKFTGTWWESGVLCFALILFLSFVIVALVDRGQRQAFALGMTVAMAGYTIAILHGPETNYRHIGVSTNHLLRQLHTVFAEVAYYDSQTGRRLPYFTPPPTSTSPQSPPYPNPQSAFYKDTFPLREHFLPTGHYWFALLLGYLGGHFARFVCLRRMAELPPVG